MLFSCCRLFPSLLDCSSALAGRAVPDQPTAGTKLRDALRDGARSRDRRYSGYSLTMAGTGTEEAWWRCRTGGWKRRNTEGRRSVAGMDLSLSTRDELSCVQLDRSSRITIHPSNAILASLFVCHGSRSPAESSCRALDQRIDGLLFLSQQQTHNYRTT